MSDARALQEATERAGACHCGTVRFRVTLLDGLRQPRRCDCSLCRMRGAVVVSARVDDLVVVEGREALTEYRFHTGTARHFFCARCGIYTHHRRRSNPDQYGVNVACLAGVSPFDFPEVPVQDGRTHPTDHAGASRLAGILRFVTAE